MKNPLRKAYLTLRSYIMARSGLQPFGQYFYSKNDNLFKVKKELEIPLSNLSGKFNSIFRQYIDYYGLGNECLLLSEGNKVKTELAKYYPQVKFLTSDFFSELTKNNLPDILWDVCLPPPEDLKNKTFDSIISHAQIEHIIAPSSALINFFDLLKPSEYIYIYILTATPSFHYHAYPRDYLRFHHDYFFDFPQFLEKLRGDKI
ncbi:hypothetical protein [Cyanobacterium aponinum]|uniref:Methyltransferase type 11 n=2 Tax=Cyanobacterium TaxID=102234 RepID=A0AAF0Z8Q3_9CHRO|nr:hypothetical protein [Cyanobacterium aponinum]WPF88366.1 hypothetical protein SAY89_16450 [Cyanobacterium aponinum AL20115]